MARRSVVAECDGCEGTGLYQGFMEPVGTAVVCLYCQGQGWVRVEYKTFVGRKHRRKVKQIQLSSGMFIGTGVGGHGDAMTYAEFKKKYPVKVK